MVDGCLVYSFIKTVTVTQRVPADGHVTVVLAPQYLRLRIAAHRAVELDRVAGQHRDVRWLLVEERFHCGNW